MATAMPTFISRISRLFTTSSMMGLSAEGTSAITIPEGAEKATVAAGCFWGVEHIYRKHFTGKGLYDARVGYCGGDTKNPSYRSVCNGNTGHAEALQIVYDPTKVTYRELIEFLYRIHDPTTPNRQGADMGTQYRSAIFYHNDEQKSIAEEVTKQANEKWWKGKISTQILPAAEWWDAEDYHQKYLEPGNNPNGYQCPTHFLRNFPALE
ncbi:peptide methionine sulfoxide [Xylogone sp. PMI_703]|nr:peptide methionine sulfoxide [Xylogone sp. PMI_703]